MADPVLKDSYKVRHAEIIALAEQGKLEDAARLYRKLLQEYPDDASAWCNFGVALRRMGHYAAALPCLLRAMELAPDKPGFISNYGLCLVNMDRGPEALAAYEKALKLAPKDPLIRKNYALALREFGQLEKALEYFKALVKENPKDTDTQWEYAITHLHLGHYEEGWQAFESRWQQGQIKERTFSAPKWQGEDLKGKTILLHEEQGFGDSILCSRYIPLIKERGACVLLGCKKPLHRLFSTLGIDQLLNIGDAAGSFDYHIPMMSLPGVFGTRLDTIPPPAKLFIPPAPPPEIKRLLDLGNGRLKVGIVWSGSTTFGRNAKRAVSIERFLPLAAIPGVQLYSLQKGPCEPDLAAAGAEAIIPALGPHLNDFADTAATVKNLDLIIMTDSSVAHLAASTGVPVWNMVPSFAYWLYLKGRSDSPWYPSMRLFRQQESGNWDAVFAEVAGELTKAAAQRAK